MLQNLYFLNVLEQFYTEYRLFFFLTSFVEKCTKFSSSLQKKLILKEFQQFDWFVRILLNNKSNLQGFQRKLYMCVEFVSELLANMAVVFRVDLEHHLESVFYFLGMCLTFCQCAYDLLMWFSVPKDRIFVCPGSVPICMHSVVAHMGNKCGYEPCIF